MSNQEENYITPEKRKELKQELEELKTINRKEISEKLKFAKSLGDLSENAEYHQAKEEQAKLEDRIVQIEFLLKSSVVISKGHSNKIIIGSTFVIKKVGNKEKSTYRITGSEEADMEAGKISNQSPLGEALLGAKEGDQVTVITPKGKVKYTVLDIK